MVIIIMVINDLEPSLVSVNIQFCEQGLCCCLVPYIEGNWIGLNVVGTRCGERYFVLHLGLGYECLESNSVSFNGDVEPPEATGCKKLMTGTRQSRQTSARAAQITDFLKVRHPSTQGSYL